MRKCRGWPRSHRDTERRRRDFSPCLCNSVANPGLVRNLPLRAAAFGGDVEGPGRPAQEEDRPARVPDRMRGLVELAGVPAPVGLLVLEELEGPLPVPLVFAEGLRAVEHPGPLHGIEVIVVDPPVAPVGLVLALPRVLVRL